MPSISRVRRCQLRLLDQADDHQLLGAGEPHASSPHPDMLFLSKRSSSAYSATMSFSSWAWCLRSLTSLLVAAGCVTGELPLAGFHERLRPAVVEALGNAFAVAQLGYRVLAAQAVQHDADLLFGGVTLARRPADVLDDLFR